MGRRQKNTNKEIDKGSIIIENNKIRILSDGRQIYYYEFVENSKIKEAIKWIEGYVGQGLKIEATLDFDKYDELLTEDVYKKLNQQYC